MTVIQKAREALVDVRSYISCQRPQAAFSRRAQSEELAMIDSALDAETEVKVRDLEWEEVTAARSDADPHREHTGDYEAVSPIGVYYIEQYFGTDSYGWRVTLHGSDDVADKDDPEDAKAAAQADFDRRIRSALVPPEARS